MITTTPRRVEKESLLRVESLSLSFGSHLVLKGLNAEIKNVIGQGQVVALFGPSGIGKTQLLKVLAGLPEPAATITGKILINDQEVTNRKGLMGVVFQNYPLFDWRTVYSNLMAAACKKHKTKKEAHEAVMAYLERFDLLAATQKNPQQLSGGQRQRVAIAQQLLCSDHLLIMDEPLSGLDPVMEEEVCKTIREVAAADETNTVIVITHNIRKGVAVADTAWCMGRDRDADGKPVPGAYIKRRFDLVDEYSLAWREGIAELPAFTDCVNEIEREFKTL